MEDGVTYGALDMEFGERFQTLRRMLGVTSFGLNLLLLEPGQRGRIHRHERQEEVYLVLEGVLTLGIEGEEREMTRGDIVRIAPGVRRQLVNRGPGRVAVLAIGGAEPHEGRDGVAYTTWDETTGARPQEVPLPDDLPPEELRGRARTP